MQFADKLVLLSMETAVSKDGSEQIFSRGVRSP